MWWLLALLEQKQKKTRVIAKVLILPSAIYLCVGKLVISFETNFLSYGPRNKILVKNGSRQKKIETHCFEIF